MKKLISLLTIVVLVAALATVAFATETPAVVVDTVEAKPGDVVVVNVSIANNPGLTMFEGVVDFDTTALEFVSLKSVGGEGWDWLCMVTDDINNPKFGTVAASAAVNPLTGDCVMLELTLKVKEDAVPGTYDVTFTVEIFGDDDADFVEAGTVVKGGVVVPCTEHVWDDGVVKTPATCKEEGVMVYTCTLCGATKEEAIPTTEHSFGEWEVTTAASCGVEGVETRTCSICGETETRPVAALEHNWVETERVEATGCTAGKVVYTCSICGETKEETLAASGEHTFAETERVEATCCEAGKVVYTCSVCGETKEDTIAATGEHAYTYEAIDEVNHKVICANSGKELSTEAHTFGEWIEDTENPGWQYQVCDKCGYEHREGATPPPTGDNTMIAVAMATVSMMGIALVVSKKKEF